MPKERYKTVLSQLFCILVYTKRKEEKKMYLRHTVWYGFNLGLVVLAWFLIM